jgi:hypothetical protein
VVGSLSPMGRGSPGAFVARDASNSAKHALSANSCIPMPVLAATTATYQMALLKGHGERDKGGMIAVFEELLSIQYRSR